jgi:peptide/nickel transport system substrate-binding protein
MRQPIRSTRPSRLGRRQVLALAAFGLSARVPMAAVSAPVGQLTWGVHVSLAPAWFDPAEMSGAITSFMLLYALHDAMLKPMPDQPMAPSLAEDWSVTEDGLSYEFVLRKGAMFHHGEPVTSDDVKFSFERYRGADHARIKERVSEVEVRDSGRIRFKLKEPWPDFPTFYVSASGAGWVVPRKYVEKVGDDGFKKAPVGAGPYKFVSFTPGVELVLEAFDGYWRKAPRVKRLVFRVIPDELTRLAALKRGEIDIAYSIRGELADDVQHATGLTLKPTVISAPYHLYFPEQWELKSPWYHQRVREAASLAIDRTAINQALTLGYSPITGSVFPKDFEFYWQPPPPTHDPDKAKELLAKAGYPGGFDAGFYNCDIAYANIGEAVLSDLGSVGIRAKLRPLERAAFYKSFSEKKLKNIIQGGFASVGNIATRLETFVVNGGAYAYGSYPDIDALYQEQAVELDRTKRQAILTKVQQLVLEKAIFAPIFQLAFINAVGPRIDESGFGLIKAFPYTAPYEDLTLKGA